VTRTTDRRERLAWTALLFGFAALTGLTLQARGALVPSFTAAFDVSPATVGLLAPATSVGFTAVAVLVGLSLGRVPVRTLVVVGSLGTAAALAGLWLAPTFVALGVAASLRTAFTGLVRGVDRPVVSHLYPASRGRFYSLLDLSWAAGAAVGPVLVTAALAVGDWRLAYLALAVVALPMAALAVGRSPPAGMDREEPLAPGDVPPVLRHPSVAGMALVLALVVGVEGVFFTWLPYFGTTFLERSSANLLLSTYLVGYVPGRYAFSRLADRTAYVRLALPAAVGAALLTAVAVTALRGPAVFPAVFAVGALVSGLYPTTVAWATDALPEYSGPVNAVALAAGQVGFATVPAAVGVLATARSIAVGMYVPAALLVALGGVVAVLSLRGVA
jgi:fucose permease